jgi:hypothetical protein
MKFENHEIWQDIMIWYVEVVEKIEYVLKTLTCTLFRNGTSHDKFLRIWPNITKFGVLEKFKFEFD